MTLPQLGDSLPEIVVRTAVVYVFLVVLLRLGGKREVGQLSIFELVVVLVIADAVQNSIIGENTTIYGGLVAALTLVTADRGLRLLTERSRRVKLFVEGEPRVLIRDGHVIGKALDDEGIDMDELRAALREHGVRRPNEVRVAVLETDGTISVVPRAENQPRGATTRIR